MTQSLIHSRKLQPQSRPVVELLMLAGPTVAQMASYTVMQFVDTWMLTRVGTTEAAAAGNAGMFAFSVISFGVGVMFIVNALVSQHFGHGDWASCGRYLWQGIWFSIGFSVLMLPAIPLAGTLFGSFGHELRLAQLEAAYFRTVVAASVVKLVGMALGQFLLAIDRPRWVLVSAVTGVGADIVAAWALVFGHTSLGRTGVIGAAWAQNLGVLVEMLLLIGFVAAPAIRKVFGVGDWMPRRNEMRALLAVGLPSGLQVVSEVLAWSIFMALVMGTFGTAAMAANTFMLRYIVVTFLPCLGISSAVTALVGRYIGMGRPDLAMKRAHLGFAIAAAYTVVAGFIYYFGREWLIRRFTSDPEIVRLGRTLLTITAFYEIFDAMYIVYYGGLRGAGDTLVPALATAGLCWGLMISGGYIIARVLPQAGVSGPWMVAMVYGITLGLFMLWRFQRGRWQAIHLERVDASATVPAFQVMPAPASPHSDSGL